jgi:hypothetical protein
MTALWIVFSLILLASAIETLEPGEWKLLPTRTFKLAFTPRKDGIFEIMSGKFKI